MPRHDLHPSLIVAVIGGCAAGKTTFASTLAALLRWPLLSPDIYRPRADYDHAETWRLLLADVRSEPRCIVESVVIPDAYAKFLHDRPSLVILVAVDELDRADRVRRRRYRPDLEAIALEPYRPRIEPETIVDGSRPVQATALRLAHRIRAENTRRPAA